MVDGKVTSIMLNLAACSCNFCGATPTMMQSVKDCLKRIVNPRAIKLGISPLHLWMRCVEFFLKIGYRLKIKKAQISKDSPESALEKSEKTRMQDQFFDRLSLKVDYPNPKGGNTNDGNSCRKLFRNYKVLTTSLNTGPS